MRIEVHINEDQVRYILAPDNEIDAATNKELSKASHVTVKILENGGVVLEASRK